MNQHVYILTNELTHSVLGVFTSYRKASIGLWNAAKSYGIESVIPEYTGVQYNCLDSKTGESVQFYIEEVELNDHYLISNDPIRD